MDADEEHEEGEEFDEEFDEHGSESAATSIEVTGLSLDDVLKESPKSE